MSANQPHIAIAELDGGFFFVGGLELLRLLAGPIGHGATAGPRAYVTAAAAQIRSLIAAQHATVILRVSLLKGATRITWLVAKHSPHADDEAKLRAAIDETCQ